MWTLIEIVPNEGSDRGDFRIHDQAERGEHISVAVVRCHQIELALDVRSHETVDVLGCGTAPQAARGAQVRGPGMSRQDVAAYFSDDQTRSRREPEAA